MSHSRLYPPGNSYSSDQHRPATGGGYGSDQHPQQQPTPHYPSPNNHTSDHNPQKYTPVFYQRSPRPRGYTSDHTVEYYPAAPCCKIL